MDKKARRRWGAALKVLLFGAGVALLAVLVAKTDSDALWGRIQQMGWVFPVAAFMYVGAVTFGALAWREVTDHGKSRARFRDLFAAYWAGESVNFLLPAGAPGEVAKGYFLRDKAQPGELVSSITLYNLGTGVVWTGLMTMSAVVVLVFTDMPPLVPYLTLGFALTLLVAVLGARLLLRRNALGRLLDATRKLPFIDFDSRKVERQVASIDERIRDLQSNNGGHLPRFLGYITMARVFNWAEVLFLLVGLMPERDFAFLMLLAFIAVTASQVVEYTTMFVPGQVGTLEGGTAGAFALLGVAATAGLAMELMRRGRKLAVVLVTLVVLLVLKTRDGLRLRTRAAE
jgi:uncharacterized protein (TIRG00374 family)